jgi:D-alanine-D-alanine ligase
MKRKMRVGILFGGRSAEHEVSVQSAKNVVHAIDKNRYDVVLIGIDKKGRWGCIDDPEFFSHLEGSGSSSLKDFPKTLTVQPGDGGPGLVCIREGKKMEPIDVIFPVLHGTFGEDGTLQGFLKLADVPFVGADHLGSAVGMDKDVMKRLLREAGVPVPDFLIFEEHNRAEITYRIVKEKLGASVFVKPANLGSSVGISKASNEGDFQKAVDDAFGYDIKIIIEEFIDGREIECSVLGNENPGASVPGEVKPKHEFYSYDAKYVDEDGALLEIPAKIPEETMRRIQELAVKTFKVLCCKGLARVDFFLKDGGEVIVNEINTLPGFTNISMYPKLWEASGLPQTQLIDSLIHLALDRYRKEKKIRRFY